MVTLGIGLMLFEAANKAAFITGGVDGLSGVAMWKVLGAFRVRPLRDARPSGYSLAVVFALFALARRIVNSPFGLSLRGIREGPRRMPAIGSPVGDAWSAIFTRERGDGRRCRRAARADDAVRRHRQPRVSALRRAHDHARAGRRRQALRRAASAPRCSWSPRTTCPASIRCTGSSGSGILLIVVVLFGHGGILGALRGALVTAARSGA